MQRGDESHEGVALWRYCAVALCDCGAVRVSCRGGVVPWWWRAVVLWSRGAAVLWRRDAGVGRSAVAPVVLVLSAVLVLFVALVLLVALAHLVALAVLMALVLWTLIRIQAATRWWRPKCTRTGNLLLDEW